VLNRGLRDIIIRMQTHLDLVQLFPLHMDCMGLEKIKKFDLLGI
jgi:hypothetical protein